VEVQVRAWDAVDSVEDFDVTRDLSGNWKYEPEPGILLIVQRASISPRTER